jgi:translation elongation factor EF-1alpha
MKGSISIEMNNLNYFTINSKNNKLIKISNIIPKRLCNLNGKYLNKINSPEFITIKFDDSNFINIKEEIISKNSFIFSEENLIIFDTFEANIILFESNLAVVAKGFECNFENYNFMSDVNFLNVNGFYSGENNEIFNKKNIINTEKNKICKCILKLKNPILSMKYESNKKIGSFMLKKDGKIFAVGKILKYKIFN